MTLKQCHICLLRFKKGGRGWVNPFRAQEPAGGARDELRTQEQVRMAGLPSRSVPLGKPELVALEPAPSECGGCAGAEGA